MRSVKKMQYSPKLGVCLICFGCLIKVSPALVFEIFGWTLSLIVPSSSPDHIPAKFTLMSNVGKVLWKEQAPPLRGKIKLSPLSLRAGSTAGVGN